MGSVGRPETMYVIDLSYRGWSSSKSKALDRGRADRSKEARLNPTRDAAGEPAMFKVLLSQCSTS